jgi:hypothetical protein
LELERPVPRTSLRLAAAALVVAMTPALAACSTGANAPTTTQQPSGNGSNANVGPLQLRGVTIVKGGGGLPVGTIIGTIVNSGTEADVLTGVSIAAPSGATATIIGGTSSDGQLAFAPRTSTQIGYRGVEHIDISGFQIDPSAFAQVVFTFEKAGKVTVPVMSVPPTGIYAGLGPLGR